MKIISSFSADVGRFQPRAAPLMGLLVYRWVLNLLIIINSLRSHPRHYLTVIFPVYVYVSPDSISHFAILCNSFPTLAHPCPAFGPEQGVLGWHVFRQQSCRKKVRSHIRPWDGKGGIRGLTWRFPRIREERGRNRCSFVIGGVSVENRGLGDRGARRFVNTFCPWTLTGGTHGWLGCSRIFDVVLTQCA